MTNNTNTRYTKSACSFAEAGNYIPGGVNSPVRAFGSVGLTPLSILIILLCSCADNNILEKCTKDSLIFIGDFETANLKGFTDTAHRWEQTIKKSSIVTYPVRDGAYAVKLRLDRIEHKNNVNYRTDILTADELGGYLRLNIGQEYWYGFSVFLPNEWIPDTQSELIAQWHASPDEGEEKRSPVLAIYIYGEEYCIKKRWDVNSISDKKRIPQKKLWIKKVAIDKSKWVDWVFHVKWSYEKDGFIEIWKDGFQIVSDNGPNCYNDEKGPYFRFGPYKWPWKKDDKTAPSVVTQRIIYFDEIRIGNHNSCFELVSPP